MDNNDIFRNICSAFKLTNNEIISIFNLGEEQLNTDKLKSYLVNPSSMNYSEMQDSILDSFLSGFIILKRGRLKDDTKYSNINLNNNIILKKLRIALSLKTEDIVEIFKKGGAKLSKNEVNAFFRNPMQNQFRICQDQYLRKFIVGLRKKHKND